MYTIYYKDNHNDKDVKIVHSIDKSDNQIMAGQIEQVLHGADVCDFEIGIENSLYGQMKPLTGLIDVFNDRDGDLEFRGRVMAISTEMDSNNRFWQEIECDSVLTYLQDSSQGYRKIPNISERDFFTIIINHHNASVEAHKRFKIGRVTMKSTSDVPYRYIGYQTTYDTIKEHVLEKIGGVLILRHEEDGMYLDWLAEEDVGDHIDSPLRWGDNILSAQREIGFRSVITRIVPVGADIPMELSEEEQADEEAYGSAVRPRVMIPSVNNNKDYIDDTELIEIFGIREKQVEWPEIDDPQLLKERGEQFRDNQRVFLASWTVETAELWLLDPRFKKYKVGNWHPIINPPISGIEELQISKKRIDLLDVKQVQVDVGSVGSNLTTYQLQTQEANKSMEAFRRKKDIIPEPEPEVPEQEIVNSNVERQINDLQTEINQLKNNQ